MNWCTFQKKIIMYIKIISILLYFNSFSSFSQPDMDFGRDTNLIQLGNIISNRGRFVYELKFHNSGDQPLIISKASTGDGGSMANWSREPTMPGDSGSIQFIYDTNRIGPINRGMYISTNAGRKIFRFRGLCVFPPTQINIDARTKDIGVIPFGETNSVTFFIENNGPEDLNLYNYLYYYPESDLIWAKTEVITTNQAIKKSNSFPPNTKLKITILLKNTHGQTGPFSRDIQFISNLTDTITFNVKGVYKGKPEQEVIHLEDAVYYYSNGKLSKKEIYRRNGTLRDVYTYKDSYCTSLNSYGSYPLKLSKTYIYSKGKVIDKINY